MTTSDADRRALIVTKSHPTPRDETGMYLDLRISLHHETTGFIRPVDGGALDLSCSTDDVLIAELTELVALLRYKQLLHRAKTSSEGVGCS